MNIKLEKYALADLMAIVLVAAMVFAAEVTGEKEIIFPEMAALSVGYLVAIKRSWMVNGRRMLFLITGCAILGVLIVRNINLGDFPEIILAFIISQIIFLYSGTTFAPFVSALVLPVMLQTTTWVYPVAAFSLTLILVLGHKLLIHFGKRVDEAYEPVILNSKNDVIDMILRIIAVSVIGGATISLGYKFVIAPPLLVAFTEFSRPRNKTRNKPIKTVALVTLCGVIGALVRYIFVIKLGFSMTFAAVMIMALSLLTIHLFHMYMPPAGAIAILSLLIPESAVVTFPLQIFVGISAFMACSRLLFMRRQDKMRYEAEHELNAE